MCEEITGIESEIMQETKSSEFEGSISLRSFEDADAWNSNGMGLERLVVTVSDMVARRRQFML
jgi:hypothetical protein